MLENLGVSEPGLEGAMRADGNVSIEGGKKGEIKNIGSFHDLEKALHFEITRQQSLSERELRLFRKPDIGMTDERLLSVLEVRKKIRIIAISWKMIYLG
ncbi:MAG: hypothetical protein CM1200mP23_4420 [Nitrososphaerota archaeon]|nr:MAG: hypothetical protein CM1200mP23_4420 [Nitrososphaerota archaeon]